MKINKKAQISYTITWVVSVLIILFILLIYFLLATAISIPKIISKEISEKMISKEKYDIGEEEIFHSLLYKPISLNKDIVALIDMIKYWSINYEDKLEIGKNISNSIKRELNEFNYYFELIRDKSVVSSEDIFGLNEEINNLLIKNKDFLVRGAKTSFIFINKNKTEINFLIKDKNEK